MHPWGADEVSSGKSEHPPKSSSIQFDIYADTRFGSSN